MAYCSKGSVDAAKVAIDFEQVVEARRALRQSALVVEASADMFLENGRY